MIIATNGNNGTSILVSIDDLMGDELGTKDARCIPRTGGIAHLAQRLVVDR